VINFTPFLIASSSCDARNAYNYVLRLENKLNATLYSHYQNSASLVSVAHFGSLFSC
jgi:hypothetical protein